MEEKYEGNKLLLSWEEGYGDNGFDLIEIIDRGKKYVFMMSYDFGGAENVPMNADGVVERSNIDWDALLEFLEKLVPIIMQIISIFG